MEICVHEQISISSCTRAELQKMHLTAMACTKQVACRLPANKSLMPAKCSHATQEDDSPWEKDELVDLF